MAHEFERRHSSGVVAVADDDDIPRGDGVRGPVLEEALREVHRPRRRQHGQEGSEEPPCYTIRLRRHRLEDVLEERRTRTRQYSIWRQKRSELVRAREDELRAERPDRLPR